MKKHKRPKDIQEKWTTALREKGSKLTSQRLEIIRSLAQDRSHPGAMEIYRKVRKKTPRISMSTVYYTLDMLKKEGLIGELQFYDKDNRYDVNVDDHINLICTECGKIADFMADLPSFSKVVEKETGFKSARMRFEYYGICRNCAE